MIKNKYFFLRSKNSTFGLKSVRKRFSPLSSLSAIRFLIFSHSSLVYTLTGLLLLLSPVIAYGQSSKLFTVDRELSSSLINKIFQDKNGMIWIATEDGLNRYDGTKFIVYKHTPKDENSLCHNYVRVLKEDSQGHLLIGTHAGIQMYDPARDNFSPRAKWKNGKVFNSNVIDILERKNGQIWVTGNQLCSLSISEDGLIVDSLDLPIPMDATDYLIEDKNQNVWVSRGENGIYRLTPDNQAKHYLTQEKGITIIDLCQDSNGNIYAGAMGKGLLKYDRTSDSFIFIPCRGEQNLPIKTLCSVSPDELYIGTDGKGTKLFGNDGQEMTDYLFDNTYFDPKTSKVHSILKDNAGNLWLALYQKGVIMIPTHTNGFKYIGHKSINKNIIGSSCITSFCRDHEGLLWIGTDNDGIYGIDGNLAQKVHFSSTDNKTSVPSTIIGLYEDSDRNLWFGSYTNGMGKLDKKTGRCFYLKGLADENGKFVQRVYGFAEDRDKRLWIATMGAGLFYYDMRTGELNYPTEVNCHVSKWINCLFLSGDNKLYVGTYDGVTCLDLATGNFKSFTLLEQHIIFSIYEDRDGLVWIGTADGLSCWNAKSKELAHYTVKDGLPANTVYAIQGDGQGYLWISTNAGISQLHKDSRRFINYYVSDGLQGNEFNKNASLKDTDGTLWFGGMNGVTYFNPQEITNPVQKWSIRITDFYLHNLPVRKGMLSGGHEIIDRPVFEAEDFYLSHEDNSFSIEFSPLELNCPERIVYHYAMNDDNWSSLPAGTRRISFSNLPPGTYRFHVKAVDYMTESDVKTITIHISPAWWATGWAQLLYFLVAAGCICYIILQIRHRYRIRQEMMKYMHAEQINEAKLQFFINISHEIRTPMSLIISPLQKLIGSDPDNERQKSYHIIYRNAERILTLINQLMDIRKIDKGQMLLTFRKTDIIPFINDLCETFAQPAKEKRITLRFHHPENSTQELWIDPSNFDKVILNILSNAFKFTPEEGRVDISLCTKEDPHAASPLKHYVEIIIADSGIGIPPQESEHIFDRFYQIRGNTHTGTGIGLHLTRSLVKLHHGNIHVENNPEGQPGCRFIIHLPMGCAHLLPEEIDDAEKDAPTLPDHSTVAMPSAATVQEQDSPQKARTAYRVLIVEDDDEIRHYICRELSAKFHIAESKDGKEALEAVFKFIPHLVISDVMMPQMDGFTLCRKIKQNVNLSHIPVILLTARIREEDNLKGLENGADAYITKPFNIEILKKTAFNLIHGREMTHATQQGQQVQEELLEKIDCESPDEKLLERIMKVINKNLGNPDFTVEILAREAGISRGHLHRKLKELTNQTTRDFIRNTRLKQAATLLSEKHYSVNEIAELTGFTNPGNFSTAFKELYGVSPTTYMKEHIGKALP